MALRDPRQQFGDAVEQTLVARGLVADKNSNVKRLPFKTDTHAVWQSASVALDGEAMKTLVRDNTTLDENKPIAPKNEGPPLPIQQGKGKGNDKSKGRSQGRQFHTRDRAGCRNADSCTVRTCSVRQLAASASDGFARAAHGHVLGLR